MAWFRVDDQAAFHAKVLMAGNEAFGAWCRAGAWSSGHGTNGRIPRAVALTIAPERVWKRLVEARLEPGGNGLAVPIEGGWQIHDFLDWNPSAEEVRAERESLREARRRAGMVGGLRSGEARRAKQDGSTDEAGVKQTRSKAEASEEANGEANAKQSRSKTEANGEAKTKQNEAPYPYPIQEFTHTPPPTPPTADESGVVVEQPASVTVVRPVGSPAPVASKGEPSSPEARRLLEAIRSHEAIRAAAMPEVATALEGRRMTRGTPVEVLVEAIGECAREAAMQAATGAPWDVTRIASQLGRYCDAAAKAWTSRPRDDRQRPRGARPAGLPPVQPQAKPGQYDWRKEADERRAQRLRELEEAAAQLPDDLSQLPMALGGGS